MTHYSIKATPIYNITDIVNSKTSFTISYWRYNWLRWKSEGL